MSLPDGFFRELSSEEEQKFRDWARNNIEDLKEREEKGTLGVYHPVVRDEWDKIKVEKNIG